MECNRDEAIRAKEIAEKKMENNDFDGARKIAVKAQNLYPELDNITQLLSICDVHCAARTRISGSEMDWYGILQVAKFADEPTVRKQYRKLALHLHPDKNRFPGAEAAFKLICEANTVLTDSAKKSVYDSKIRVTVRSAAVTRPPHHMTNTYQFNKQYGAPNNVFTGFSSLNSHQPTQSSFSVGQDVFLTSCPFCSAKHQHPRELSNTMLCCQHCSKSFVGYELGGPVGPKRVPPTAPVYPDVSQFSGVQTKPSGVGSSVTQEAARWSASRRSVRPEVRVSKSKCAAKISRATKGEEGVTYDGDASSRHIRKAKNNSTKKGRKRAMIESSDSCDSSSDSDVEEVTVIKDLNSGPDQAHFIRRSSRKRPNVTYNQGNGDDDDDDDDGDDDGDDNDDDNDDDDVLHSVHPEKSTQPGMFGDGADAIVVESDSDRDSNFKEDSGKDIYNCDDTEFNDFDKDRDESCFFVDQLWACYDEADGMPRFYAKIKKVIASPFKLSFTWLEAVPLDEAHRKWAKADLPVGCGVFKLGRAGSTSSRLTFSHRVLCEKGNKRGTFVIYPRKGEVWALFKEWDLLSWSSDPDNHRKYMYEIVEVLSDFASVDGAKVCYLDKVGGFVSLFRRSGRNETDSFRLGPNELYKFSHRVPCYKTRGDEREGVPSGSFELDPASLPLNPCDLYYPGKEKTDKEKPPESTRH